MFNIIFFIFIFICLLVVIFVIGRKFPLLSNLDVSNIPQEKVLRKKKDLITNRVEEKGKIILSIMGGRLAPFKKFWDWIQTKFRIYVYKVQKLWHHEQVIKKKLRVETITGDKEQQKNQLVAQAENCLRQKDYDQAEELFISIISIDPKSAVAYRGLGDTYLAKNQKEEARQTYRFLARLEPDDDSTLVKLAEIAESQGDLEEAIEYYQQTVLINDMFASRFYHLAELLQKVNQPTIAKEAVAQAIELEPQNPKYLDLLVEIAIICGDKELARKGFDNLRLVNPENHKLDSFRDRIDKIRIAKK